MSPSQIDISPSDRDPELPPIDDYHQKSRGKFGHFLSSIFGGSHIERRPLPIILVILAIIFVGFVVGTLFTMGILSGVIEIDPKAIKTIFKSLMGKT